MDHTLRHEGLALDISRAEISDAGNADREGARSNISTTRWRAGPRRRTSRPSIRARSRITALSSPIRCASTPPARITAPARPPISPMTRSTTPRATRSVDADARAVGLSRHSEREFGPLAIWKNWAKEVSGKPIDSGHFLPEENPDATAARSARILPTLSDDQPSTGRQRFPAPRTSRPPCRSMRRGSATYLSDHIAGFEGPLTIRQFRGGQSNPTYLLETPTRRYVLRRKPPGKLLPSAHAVDREFRIISAL